MGAMINKIKLKVEICSPTVVVVTGRIHLERRAALCIKIKIKIKFQRHKAFSIISIPAGAFRSHLAAKRCEKEAELA